MFWHRAVCVCVGWVVRADINAGDAWETSDLAVCCGCGDVGSILLSACDGDGMRDTEMGETNVFSMCRGEMGETEGVAGTVCPGERKM